MLILEGKNLFDKEGRKIGPLELEEGQRSERMLIIESAELSDIQEVPLNEAEERLSATLVESGRRGKLLAFEGRFQMADTKNANKRIYPDSIWERILEPNGKWMQRIKNGDMLGELDHPKDGETRLERVSHRVTEMKRSPHNRKEIRGRLVVFDTERGRTAKAIHEGGGRLGVSSRGQGSVVREGGNDLVQNDYDLDTTDIVYNPSTPGAYPSEVSESTLTQPAQEMSEMSRRLNDLTERLARFKERGASTLTEDARSLLTEEVIQIKEALTTEDFGTDSPKAAVAATEAVMLLRDLKEGPTPVFEGTVSVGDTVTLNADWAHRNLGGAPDWKLHGRVKKTSLNSADVDWDTSKLDARKKELVNHRIGRTVTQSALSKVTESVSSEEGTRPTTLTEAIEVVDQISVDTEDLQEATRSVAQEYRERFGIEGPLKPFEYEAVTARAQTLAEGTFRAEQEGAVLTARIYYGTDLTESHDEEISATSEADLRRSIAEKIEGREGLVLVEVDRSEQIYRDAADRFSPIIEQQVLKRKQAVEDAAARECGLSETSAKLACALQVIENLGAKFKAAMTNLTEASGDKEAAFILIDALSEEVSAERLRGVVEGIASTHQGLNGLHEHLSQCTSVEEAIAVTKRLIVEDTRVNREPLNEREMRVNQTLVATQQAENQLFEKQRWTPPARQNVNESSTQTIVSTTHRVVDALKAHGMK